MLVTDGLPMYPRYRLGGVWSNTENAYTVPNSFSMNTSSAAIPNIKHAGRGSSS
jgi:hypothetical protein